MEIQTTEDFIAQVHRICEGRTFYDLKTIMNEIQQELLTPRAIIRVYDNINFAEPPTDVRFLTYCRRNVADYNDPFVRISNGAIYSINPDMECKLICMPAHSYNPGAKTSVAKNNIDDYDIYEIQDGTTITMYRWNDSWVCSTHKLIELRGKSWRGKNRGEALTEVFEAYQDFRYSALDLSKCWTFTFCHPEYHPLQTKKSIRLICSYDLNTKVWNYNENESIGLPVQSPLAERLTYEEMVKKAQSSLIDYLDFLHGKTKECKPVYGYILRERSTTNEYKHGADAHIFIESMLMGAIRRLFYHIEYINNKAILKHIKRRFCDIRYTILRAYLNVNTRKLYRKLVPHHKERYQHIIDFIEKVVEIAYERLLLDNASDKKINYPHDKELLRETYFTKQVFSMLKASITVNALSEKEIKKLIKDKIRDPLHIDHYMDALYSDEKTLAKLNSREKSRGNNRRRK